MVAGSAGGRAALTETDDAQEAMLHNLVVGAAPLGTAIKRVRVCADFLVLPVVFAVALVADTMFGEVGAAGSSASSGHAASSHTEDLRAGIISDTRCAMHWTTDISTLFQPIRELSLHSPDESVRSVMSVGVPELGTPEYDNWNGGTSYYPLVIHVPISTYARIEPELERVEQEILRKIERYTRGETSEFITRVLVQPSTTDVHPEIPLAECRFWSSDYFRVFVSHLSANKLSATKLKEYLEPLGICAFVAHEDIEPTKEWQDELEKALFSMDAMVAILGPNFGKSKWTDQEVGVALGRGKLVLPILYGIEPYGLLGKYQGFQSLNKSLPVVGEAVFSALLKNPKTSGRLASCYSEQLIKAESPGIAEKKVALLQRLEDLPSEYLTRIRATVVEREDLLQDQNFLKVFNVFLDARGAEPVQPMQTKNPPDDEIPF